MVYGFLAIGFLLLLVGSEAVLRGGAGLARALGVPAAFGGLLIATLAMSAPELSIAIQASARRLPDLALGNAVGSTLANVLLVFGLGALLRPMPAAPRVVYRDGGALLLAALVLAVAMLCGRLPRLLGVVLLAGWLLYLVIVYATDLRRSALPSGMEAKAPQPGRGYGGSFGAFLFAIGLVCIFFGGRFAVDFGIVLAHNLGVPVLSVALTLVALGTALPELVSVLVSAARGHTNAASSRLIASSAFNILLVLGVAAVLRPLRVDPALAHIDGPVLVAGVLALLLMMMPGWRLTRGQSVLLLLGYAAYVASVALRSGLHFH